LSLGTYAYDYGAGVENSVDGTLDCVPGRTTTEIRTLQRYCYTGNIRFRAPRQYAPNTTVIFTFEGVDYRRRDGVPLDLSQLKFCKQNPIAYDNSLRTVSYLLTVDGGGTNTISERDFQWPPDQQFHHETYSYVNPDPNPCRLWTISKHFAGSWTEDMHWLSWTNFHNEPAVRIKWVDHDGFTHYVESSPGDVMVGEKVELTAEPKPGLAITPKQWIISGQSVKDYTQTLDSGQIITNSTTDLQGTNVVFRWTAGGATVLVRYVYLFEGREHEARARFNIYVPTASLTSTPTTENPPVGMRQVGGFLMMVFGSPASPGITWTASVGRPVIGGGSIGLVQRVNMFRTQVVQTIFSGIVTQHLTTAGAFMLDSVWDTPQAEGPIPIDTGTPATELLPKRKDYPGLGVDTNTFTVAADDRFEDYLMYQSDQPGSVWVTLRKMTWQWSATATNDGAGWTVVTQSSSATTSAPSSELPVWIGHAQDINWQ
jgi:hypothetical protein